MKIRILTFITTLAFWTNCAIADPYLLICADGKTERYLVLSELNYMLFDDNGMPLAFGTLTSLPESRVLGAKFGNTYMLVGIGEVKEYAVFFKNESTKTELYLECK